MFSDEKKPEKDEQDIVWPTKPDKIEEADVKPSKTKEEKNKFDEE